MSVYEELMKEYKNELNRGFKISNIKVDDSTTWTKEDENKNQAIVERDKRETKKGKVTIACTLKRNLLQVEDNANGGD